MNHRITTLIFAGNIILFSACNQANPNETKQASITTTTGGTTSGSEGMTTSYSHEKSGLMETMKSTMSQLKQMKMTGDPDYDFASMMIIHHEGGIKLANEEISNGKNQELVMLAKQIKQEQEADKMALKTIKSNKQASVQNQAFLDEVNKQMPKSEKDLKEMTMTGDVDQDFAMLMSMHHRRGIEMAKNEVKYGKDQKLKSMAQKSIDRQQKQIQKLEAQVSASKK